jgi:hypothetical protein
MTDIKIPRDQAAEEAYPDLTHIEYHHERQAFKDGYDAGQAAMRQEMREKAVFDELAALDKWHVTSGLGQKPTPFVEGARWQVNMLKEKLGLT